MPLQQFIVWQIPFISRQQLFKVTHFEMADHGNRLMMSSRSIVDVGDFVPPRTPVNLALTHQMMKAGKNAAPYPKESELLVFSLFEDHENFGSTKGNFHLNTGSVHSGKRFF